MPDNNVDKKRNKDDIMDDDIKKLEEQLAGELEPAEKMKVLEKIIELNTHRIKKYRRWRIMFLCISIGMAFLLQAPGVEGWSKTIGIVLIIVFGLAFFLSFQLIGKDKRTLADYESELSKLKST